SFYNLPPTTQLHTLSLHDALPILNRLVTLLTTKEPEIQFVALRNINLIVQRRPGILAHEMRVFFIKYNDPIYVKMEKLEIMIMRSEEHTSELQSRENLVCRLLLEK